MIGGGMTAFAGGVALTVASVSPGFQFIAMEMNESPEGRFVTFTHWPFWVTVSGVLFSSVSSVAELIVPELMQTVKSDPVGATTSAVFSGIDPPCSGRYARQPTL